MYTNPKDIFYAHAYSSTKKVPSIQIENETRKNTLQRRFFKGK